MKFGQNMNEDDLNNDPKGQGHRSKIKVKLKKGHLSLRQCGEFSLRQRSRSKVTWVKVMLKVRYWQVTGWAPINVQVSLPIHMVNPEVHTTAEINKFTYIFIAVPFQLITKKR